MLSFLPCCLVSSLNDLLTPRPCNSCVPINELFEVKYEKYEKLFLLPLFPFQILRSFQTVLFLCWS